MEDVLQDRTIVLGREKLNPPVTISSVELYAEAKQYRGGIKQKKDEIHKVNVESLLHIHSFSLVVAHTVTVALVG